MGIFDWLHRSDPEPETHSGLSRRDFLARVAGQGQQSPSPPSEEVRPNVLYTFYVARFPYHDGPVLVPMLKQGLDFLLTPDPTHAGDPEAVKILWGRDHLGYVPPEHSADVHKRLMEGEKLRCTALSVDPGADLSRVLWVEIAKVVDGPAEEEEWEEEDPPQPGRRP